MERRSIFNKGRQGHSRVLNSYLVFRQKSKKWKIPMVGLGVFLALMVSVDLAGDTLKTSVIEGLEASKAGDSGISITAENLEIAKKGFLVLLKNEMDSCKELGITECVAEGQKLVDKVSGIETAESANAFMAEVESFGIRWTLSKETISCEKHFEDALSHLTIASQALNGDASKAGIAGKNVLTKAKEEILGLSKTCDL